MSTASTSSSDRGAAGAAGTPSQASSDGVSCCAVALPGREWKKLAWGVAVFVVFFALPVGWVRFEGAVIEAMSLAKWYAQEHVLLCLVPAFFIAGALAVFIDRGMVMKYLGAGAPKPVAYAMASVSGTILAVCSCTVLPLFAGIRRMGAGLGPATTFLYAGPAINVLAIVLTAAVLGPELGAARAVGAIVFSIVIGLVMHVIYRREDAERDGMDMALPAEGNARPLWQTGLYFAAMVGILVFANWGKPEEARGLWHAIWSGKWVITSVFGVALGVMLVAWFGIAWWKMLLVGVATAVAWAVSAFWLLPVYGASLPGFDRGLAYDAMIPFAVATVGLALVLSVGARPGEAGEWMDQTWGFAKQITPLLLIGVLAAGFLLGTPWGGEGMVPPGWVASLVGGNSIEANLFASAAGAFMYFATLTEVPILQGLIGSGMGKGPALALLLAGPALSLPNMLVIRSVLGTQKTVVFVALVIVMSTLTGWLYGVLF